MADIESLKQALSVSPENVPLILLLGTAYLDSFHLAEAREQFDRAVTLDPQNVDARVGVAQVLDLEGRTSEAILRMEQVCTEYANHGPAWKLRAKMALKEGDAADARAHYDRAVTIDPNLADGNLLKRIEQAGGQSTASRPKDESHATPQASGDWQAGAYYEPDFDEGDDDLGDPFSDDFDSDPPSDLELDFVQRADVNFKQVGGMDSVKEDIRMKILYPMQNADLFAAYGKKAGGGVLLYGPPGCGKTLISRATAGEINAKFISVGLHQILDMWIGKSEEKLHEIFELARRQAPSVLFFDEVDALAADRKDMRTSAGRTLINQFLAEMDGNVAENDGVLVLGATNAPWHLDSAFLRPGRFDRLIFVPPPDAPAREEIIRIMAEGKPVKEIDPKALAKRIPDFSGADIKAVFDQSIEAALTEAMKVGEIVPVSQKMLAKTAKQVKPSTRKWFESAKNYALYANQSGFYDDVLEYLGIPEIMSDHLARGQLLRHQGRYDEAEAFLRQAIGAEPDDVSAYIELASCLSAQDGRKREALSTIDRAVALEPDDAHIHSQRALILSRLDRDKEALEAVEQAMALGPDDSALFAVKAQALTGLQRYAEAEEACREALSLDADNGHATNLLAHLLRIQGKQGESELASAKLLSDDPEDPYAHFNAGWTALQRNDQAAAEGHFREALRLDADFEPAREGLLESFRARSAFYRTYLRWCFWMQRFTEKAQWGIIIGFLIAYHFGRKLLSAIHPLAGVAIVILYLGFVLWVWLAPGIGNLLVLLDRSARHALRRGEAWQGIMAGGGIATGALILGTSALLSFPPGYLFGGALVAGAIPAALTFGNESRQGRLVFGGILAFIYAIGLGVGTFEVIRHPASELSGRSEQLVSLGILATVACTWLGNIPRLREERPG